MNFKTLAFFMIIVLSGCVTPRYGKFIEKWEGNKTTDEVIHEADELDLEADYPVSIVVKKLPAGLAWGKKNRLVSSSTKYKVLGEIGSSQKEDSWTALGKSIYWYVDLSDKHSGFRDGYCKAQLPLRILTALLWSITPFQWPCFGWQAEDNTAQELHFQELRRLAYAMGANQVYIRDLTSNRAVEGWAVKASSP